MADERNVTRDTRKSIASEYISKPDLAGLDQTIVHARMFNVGKYKITYLKNAVPNSLDQVWRANITLNKRLSRHYAVIKSCARNLIGKINSIYTANVSAE